MLELGKYIENIKQIALLAQEERAFLKEELAFARSERAATRQSTMSNNNVEEEDERAAKRSRV